MNTRVIATALLILLAVGAVVSLGISQRNRQQKTQPVAPPSLTDYINQDATVKLTIEGPVVANEQHRSSVIAASRNTRSYDLYKTYSNTSAASKTYPNNQTAFSELMYALQRAGFTKPKLTGTDPNPAGYCPLGQRYTYDLILNDQVKSSLWSTSCETLQGTFSGDGSLVRQLMILQIPDYTALSQTK